MSEARSDVNRRRLIGRLAADPRDGPLIGFLATTYDLNPDFLETDFLPSVFGLGAWDDRSRGTRIALERRLSEADAVVVFTEGHRFAGGPRSRRIEVRPVAMKGSAVLHAKVALLVRENAVRLLVGSANLTRPGYRANLEVGAVLSASGSAPGDAHAILDALDGLRAVLGPDWSESADVVVEAARRQLVAWGASRADDSLTFVWSGRDTRLSAVFVDHWPAGEVVERISIVSPFWSEEDQDGPVATFVQALSQRGGLGSKAELRLLTCAGTAGDEIVPRLPPQFLSVDFRSMNVCAKACAVDSRVLSEEVDGAREGRSARELHAKVVLVEGAVTSLAYLGSANFTRQGWGFLRLGVPPNIEAGLLLTRRGEARTGLRSLLPAVCGRETPLNGDGTGLLLSPPPDEQQAAWPAFLREVRLVPDAQEAGRLALEVTVHDDAVRGNWSLRVAEGSSDVLAECVPGAATPLVLRLAAAQLEEMLRQGTIWIRWWGLETGCAFPFNVALAARCDLPVAPGATALSESSLLEYYQGRIAWDDLFPDPDESPVATPSPGDDTHVGSVDTSRIQSYQVRAFVEALSGLRGDIADAARSSPGAMRQALVGPVSPRALARAVFEAANAGGRTPMAAAFELVEILECLCSAREAEVDDAHRARWSALVAEAVTEVEALLEGLRQRHPGELGEGTAFSRFARITARRSAGNTGAAR